MNTRPDVSDEVHAVKDLLRKVIPNQETVFDLVEEVDGKKLTISHRKLNPEPPVQPVIAPAKARNHVFYDVDVFADYLRKKGDSEQTLVLGDFDSERIVAVINEAQETDREEVTFQAKLHPLFQPWAALLGKGIPAIQFALHCQQYRRTISEPDGRHLALLFSQITVSKSITVKSGIGKKSLNGVMVQMSIEGTVREAAVEIPDEIVIKCPIYLGGPLEEITIDLLVDQRGEDQPVLVYLTAAELLERKVNSFQAMINTIRDAAELLAGLGCIKHRDWETLKAK